MATTTHSRAAIVDRLISVFRAHGFAGASLSELATASGLGRASLYHHFPGGKEEMGRAALAQVGQRFAKLVMAPLSAREPAQARLAAMIDGLETFYDCTPLACLINTMTLGGADNPYRGSLAASLSALIERIAATYRELGLNASAAEAEAESLVVAVHGALVVGRATDDATVFKRTLARLRARLQESVQ